MLANKLNYGDTIGVVGVANSLKIDISAFHFFIIQTLYL